MRIMHALLHLASALIGGKQHVSHCIYLRLNFPIRMLHCGCVYMMRDNDTIGPTHLYGFSVGSPGSRECLQLCDCNYYVLHCVCELQLIVETYMLWEQ